MMPINELIIMGMCSALVLYFDKGLGLTDMNDKFKRYSMNKIQVSRHRSKPK